MAAIVFETPVRFVVVTGCELEWLRNGRPRIRWDAERADPAEPTRSPDPDGITHADSSTRNQLADTNDCIEWDLPLDHGYGRVRHEGRTEYVHRLAYAEVHGSIPDGMEIDHLCGNPACFNVDHLEAVTHQVNIQRVQSWQAGKTHCPSGHPYNGDNLIRGSRGERKCRTCHRDETRRRRGVQ